MPAGCWWRRGQVNLAWKFGLDRSLFNSAVARSIPMGDVGFRNSGS